MGDSVAGLGWPPHCASELLRGHGTVTINGWHTACGDPRSIEIRQNADPLPSLSTAVSNLQIGKSMNSEAS